ncbi:MAG: S41 family peptidase [Fimbriimonadaceae bacterium]|nr:S41 family peptidase [Chitinophagales bacterium]
MHFKILLSCIFLFTQLVHAQTINSSERMKEIVKYINEEYAYDINIDSILDKMVSDYLNDTATIHALFKHLDPHSNYMDEKEYKELKVGLSGNFQGVGLVFTIFNDTILITKVFDGGPAEKAGLKTGDKLIKINNKDFIGKGLSYDDVMYTLRGAKGTEVELSVKRNNKDDLIHLHATRDNISIKNVEAFYMLDKQTGYLKFSSFSDNTIKEVHDALQQLNAAGMKKLILDLRDNYGGYFSAAIGVADEFLPENTLLVYTEGRPGTRKDTYTEKHGLFEKGPMIVLVSEATASSAEILTGALQDNKRAVIMGKRSYGKGLVQNLFPLADSVSAIKLTTARYFTPSGRCIQRSYDEGVDTYNEEYIAILNNNGVLPDSLKKNKNIDWGIIPDRYVAEDTTPVNKLFNQLYYRYHLSQVAYSYYADHIQLFEAYKTADEFNKNYKPDDILFEKFKKYVAEQEKSPDNYYPELIYTDAELNNARTKIETAFKAYFAQARWGDAAYYTIINSMDAEIIAAKDLLKE